MNDLMQLGLQLYTLRDVIMDNPKDVIRKVAAHGYGHIESYEGPLGMYWGMGNTGFRDFLDDLGLTMISTHTDVFSGFERKADEAAEIGVYSLVCPTVEKQLGPRPHIDAFREMADTFNQIGQIAKNAGIKFVYHNHAYSFREMDGEIPQKVLMDSTDPELVEYQMDIYWVVATGHDPVEWIMDYPNRFTLSHVKDGIFDNAEHERAVGADGVNGDDRDEGHVGGSKGIHMESVILGTGSINLQRILKTARQNGMKYFFTEQEEFTGTTPTEAVRQNAAYMKKLRI
ncbi:MAG: sugar phosphate isomerase/epimerase family protein [Bacteroidota bacterium]